jgi:hypothetical protein
MALDGWGPAGLARRRQIANAADPLSIWGSVERLIDVGSDVPFRLNHGRVPLMSSIAMSTSVATSLSVSGESRARIRGRYARLGLATVVAAVIANVLVYFAGDAVVGYDPEFVVLGNVVGIAIFTLIPAIVSVLLYAVLLRRTANPARVFTIVAAVVFVVTTIPDFTYIPSQPGATNGQTAILVLMHIVAAGVIVRMLTSYTRPRAR